MKQARQKSAKMAVIVILSTIAGGVMAVPAEAAPKPKSDIVIVNEPGVVTVTIPDRTSTVKKPVPALNEDVTTMSLPCVAQPFASCQFNLYPVASRMITPPGGSSGELRSSGSVFVDVYLTATMFFTSADFYSTTSYSNWGGFTPYNATSVKHADVWDIDYIGGSISFGGAPSATVNLGNGKLRYENLVSNTYRVDHSVQHVWISAGAGNIHTVKYEVHGSFQFGSNFYTTDGYAAS